MELSALTILKLINTKLVVCSVANVTVFSQFIQSMYCYRRLLSLVFVHMHHSYT